MVQLVLPFLACGFVAGALLGPFGLAGVLAPLLGLPPQRLGGPVQRRRRLVCDGCRDDERDLALVDELRCGADDVDDGGAVAAAAGVGVGLFEERRRAGDVDVARVELGAAQRVAERRGVVAREPGAARLDGVGDGDLDDPRHPADGRRSAVLYQNRRTPYSSSSSRR